VDLPLGDSGVGEIGRTAADEAGKLGEAAVT
jgi:hypothetical protein